MEGNKFRPRETVTQGEQAREFVNQAREKLSELETLVAHLETMSAGDAAMPAKQAVRETDLGKRLAKLLLTLDTLAGPEKGEREKWMQACLTKTADVFEGNDSVLRILGKDKHSFSTFERDFWHRDNRRFPIHFLGQLLLEAETLFENKGIGPKVQEVIELGLASRGLSVKTKLPEDFKHDLVAKLSPLIKAELQKEGYSRYYQDPREKPLTVDAYLSKLIEPK